MFSKFETLAAKKSPAKKAKKVTPLMQQYNAIKVKYPDAMLLFRVGDFYETFGQDAITAANILNIVLTKRGNGSESETALAGFPHHSLNTYLPKLVKAGQRVAICDQLEDPKQTKTIVKRGVTELVTPGISLNDEVLKSKSNNFLCALHYGKKQLGIAFLDISTGEFLTAQGDLASIDKLLQNFTPSEVLVSKPKKNIYKEEIGDRYLSFFLEDWVFQEDYAKETLNEHFKTQTLKGFGVQELPEGIIAAGAVIHYVKSTQHNNIEHISKIQRIIEDEYVWMDRFTVRNLELHQSTSFDGVTLLDVIDYTQSAMGGRMLKRWLALPLKNRERIEMRHEVVDFFIQEEEIHEKTHQQIGRISDIERLVSKLATGKIAPREVNQLKNSLDAIAPIKEILERSNLSAVQKMGDALHDCELLRQKIETTLDEEAPVNILKGKTIADGFNSELDELRQLAFSGKDYLDNMLARESETTGIPSLKIASNNVFGYYIEVRNTHKDKVPEHWIRKQTLVNAERYITEELKEYETKILGAEEKIIALEQQLFQELLAWMHGYIQIIQTNGLIIGQLDCLCGFASLAKLQQYVCPQFTDGNALKIIDGRHPVIEKQLPAGESYITNDVYLDREQQQIIMITGPNMSGKSAILRQTALIVLLSQIGCFVPAKKVEMGIVDKIFTRVGASDNISMGESTFMVEMNETASILNNLSENSLILLDEIGRGTSTYDGISIAWAISQYLHEHPTKPKTLFATHYHELNEMCDIFERIKNFNVAVKEIKDNVIFLRKLQAGGSQHSFGIHVAKMAGMPNSVIRNAQKMLKQLEKTTHHENVSTTIKQNSEQEMQLSFFNLDDPLLEDIKNEIIDLDINTLTPVEALMKLNEIKRLLSPKKQKG